VQQFEDMKDDYLRERASDIRDIGRRVLAELQSSQHEDIAYPRRTILVGEEVTAAALAEVPEGQLAGVVSAKGANNSHVAILARALGVPAVMGVRGLKLEHLSRRAIIVDGYKDADIHDGEAPCQKPGDPAFSCAVKQQTCHDQGRLKADAE
jgi:phosphotransferase system enzyme I (PtsP)